MVNQFSKLKFGNHYIIDQNCQFDLKLCLTDYAQISMPGGFNNVMVTIIYAKASSQASQMSSTDFRIKERYACHMVFDLYHAEQN